MFLTVFDVGVSIANESEIFGHIVNFVNECGGSALDTFNFTVFMEVRAAFFAKGVSTHNKKFGYMFRLIILGLASCAIHLKLLVYFISKRLIFI